jgi:phosphonate transport system substrate-binding protein
MVLWNFPWPSAAVQLAQLRLTLTLSQSPTSLQEPGEQYAGVLSQRLGIPVKVYIASDYAEVIEASRSKNVDLAFVHPGC